MRLIEQDLRISGEFMEDVKRKQVLEYAVEGFRNGLNCAESIFDAMHRAGMLNMPKEAIAMCVGFGAGIGMSGYTCGALSAAVMVLGAQNGRPDPWAIDAKERGAEIAKKHYRQYNCLVHDFVQANGSALCREINAIGGYQWQDKERKAKCMKIVVQTAGLVYDYLTMPQEQAYAMEYKENMAGMK